MLVKLTTGLQSVGMAAGSVTQRDSLRRPG